MTRPHILIVDTYPHLPHALAMLFELDGFTTFTAPTANEAIEIFHKNTEIRFVLSEFDLGKQTGQDIQEAIAADIRSREGIFIFMTHEQFSRRVYALRIKGFSVVVKPQIHRRVMEIFNSFIDSGKTQQTPTPLHDSPPS